MEYQWGVTIDYWKKTVQKARTCGVTKIALENHLYHIVFNFSTIRRLRNATDPMIGLNLDPSHMFFMDGTPLRRKRRTYSESQYLRKSLQSFP
jgi:sugar phosphate isomerase/epimerase